MFTMHTRAANVKSLTAAVLSNLSVIFLMIIFISEKLQVCSTEKCAIYCMIIFTVFFIGVFYARMSMSIQCFDFYVVLKNYGQWSFNEPARIPDLIAVISLKSSPASNIMQYCNKTFRTFKNVQYTLKNTLNLFH